ncbi:MAG TPA: gamma-glutamylcyclotransferase family protein [Opitutaceae bacterium]|nr:gamma-glutamylcyclotransferase family protein [Opitutaceae bacterium]
MSNYPGSILIFVYGTLKRGGVNHPLLAAQRYRGEARTEPGYRLYELDGYPGMVRDPADTDGVTGEVWLVDGTGLEALDALEGLDEGWYRREPIGLCAPFDREEVQGYVYARSVAGRRKLGPTWGV